MKQDQAQWIAHLARLDLSSDELEALTGDLSSILDYVELLAEVDTEGVEPMVHPVPVHNVFRHDESAPSLPVEEALQNAPSRGDDYFRAPAVLGGN